VLDPIHPESVDFDHKKLLEVTRGSMRRELDAIRGSSSAAA
jgi:hypothetical protein